MLLVMVLMLGGIWVTGHHGLALFAAGGFALLVILLLTGNLALAGLTTVLVASVVVLNFTGHIRYNTNRLYCFDGYHATGPWTTVWAVGHLEFRIRSWYCPADDQYDPREYKRL